MAASVASGVKSWGVAQVGEWLKGDFHEYVGIFAKSKITGSVLSTISDADLSKMGVSDRIHRRALLAAIADLIASAK